jgi:cyclin K
MQEVERTQTIILQTEEALLEALCFDFVVDSPHALLVDFFAANEFPMAQEKAWTLAHDSYVCHHLMHSSVPDSHHRRFP